MSLSGKRGVSTLCGVCACGEGEHEVSVCVYPASVLSWMCRCNADCGEYAPDILDMVVMGLVGYEVVGANLRINTDAGGRYGGVVRGGVVSSGSCCSVVRDGCRGGSGSGGGG